MSSRARARRPTRPEWAAPDAGSKSRGARHRLVRRGAAAVGDGVDDAAKVGDELFGVVDVLDQQVGLRRALSDPAVTGDRKAASYRPSSVHTSPTARSRSCRPRACSRWSRMRDLGDAIETLAVLASLIAADAHPGRGHRAGETDDVEDELFRFGRIVEGNPALREALSDRALPDENKVSLVAALVEAQARPDHASALDAGRDSSARALARRCDRRVCEVASRRRERLVARVTTAVALSDAEAERLRLRSPGSTGTRCTCRSRSTTRLIGGVVVHVGDEILDGSVAGRLADARRRLE